MGRGPDGNPVGDPLDGNLAGEERGGEEGGDDIGEPLRLFGEESPFLKSPLCSILSEV
jgi:hypothetical protein